ncbi:MAG TPA: hypothetical protein ENJ09_11970 [Planctomycetes bacterium]|nr:hypothetical protein [Planctomycetota bacterium]
MAPSRRSDTGPSLGSRRLRALFLDLLDRSPTAAEREHWRGRDAHELLDTLTASLEFWENWLERELYYFLLVVSFRPTSERVLEIPSELAGGHIGVREALRRIALSPSFDRRNPGADTFCTVMLEQFLGIVVQEKPRLLESAKRLYDGRSGKFLGGSGRSQADVVRLVIDDPGTLRFYLARLHRSFLRTEAPERELRRLSERLAEGHGALRSILREWGRSDAYEARLDSRRPLSNRAFTRSLFVDLTDALPSPEEEQRMRAALDGLANPGPLRAVVARLLLDSGTTRIPARDAIEDPRAWIRELFDHLLTRQPTEAELDAFVSSLADPACRPETVVYAILSDPAYPTW